MIDRIKIGSFLRALRNEKGMTQEELAEKFGVSSRSVSRWENGNTMPELGLLVELAVFYEVDIKEIIDGERKSENMEKEVIETLTKAADYAKEEKQLAVKSVKKKSYWQMVAIVFLLVLLPLGAMIYKFVSTPQSFGGTEMANARNEAIDFAYLPIQVEHGEDAPVEWVDAGMEARIRFLLGKETGTIYRSDVWDVQVLKMSSGGAVMLSELLEGAEAFDRNLLIKGGVKGTLYGDKTFPDIMSLQDLHYFDSLQYFDFTLDDTFAKDNSMDLDLSGLEQCRNLKNLRLYNVIPVSWEPLREMEMLEQLYLHSCGAVDLEHLKNLANLTNLTLQKVEVATLEPLTAMQGLRYLELWGGSTYPDLEPLRRTSIAYLDMREDLFSNTKEGRKKTQDLDYSILAEMPELEYLDLTNHGNVDADQCEMLLTGCEKLTYLDISFTDAATELALHRSRVKALTAGKLTAFIYEKKAII